MESTVPRGLSIQIVDEVADSKTDSLQLNETKHNSNLFCCCRCIPGFEQLLFEYRWLSLLFGMLLYCPLLLILFILMILVFLPVTIIINTIIYILSCGFCCVQNCNCTRVLDKCIKNLAKQDTVIHNSRQNSVNIACDMVNKNDSNLQTEKIRVLQYNLFCFYGYGWTRDTLICKVLNNYKPDIICVEEAITSYLTPISTYNVIKRIGSRSTNNNINEDYNYNTFFCSLLNHGRRIFPIIFLGPFWSIVSEISCFVNSIFLMSTFKDRYWSFMLRSRLIGMYLFCFYTNVIFHVGNLISFKNCSLYYKDFLLMTGFRICLRSLYISKNKNKSIWIFCSHLTSETEKHQTNKGDYDADNTGDYNYNYNSGDININTLNTTGDHDKQEEEEKQENNYKTNKDEQVHETEMKLKSQTISRQDTSNKNKVTVQQMKEILEWMKQTETETHHKGDAIIFCGDMNVEPYHQVYSLMKQNGFKSCMFEKHGQEKYTFPTDTFTYGKRINEKLGCNHNQTIDYIWYKGDIVLEDAQLVGTNEFVQLNYDNRKIYPSDHFGILASFNV